MTSPAATRLCALLLTLATLPSSATAQSGARAAAHEPRLRGPVETAPAGSTQLEGPGARTLGTTVVFASSHTRRTRDVAPATQPRQADTRRPGSFPGDQLVVACADSANLVALGDDGAASTRLAARCAPLFGLGQEPAGALAFDGPDRLYVASPGTGRVEILDGRGRALGQLGAGERDFHPTALAVGADGRVFVGTAGGRHDIVVFDPSGARLGGIDHPALQLTTGLVIGPGGHLFASSPELDAVLEFDLRGQPVRALGLGRLDDPRGLAFGPGGLLHVVSQGSDEVVVLDRQDRLVTSLGQAVLDRPSDLAFAPDGTLYVSSPASGRLALFEDSVHGGFFTELEDEQLSAPVALAFAPTP